MSFFHMHGYTSFDAEVKARKTSTFLLVTASSQSESVYVINLILAPGSKILTLECEGGDEEHHSWHESPFMVTTST